MAATLVPSFLPSRPHLFQLIDSNLLILSLQPNREDEYARIEAQGGKVINWNGYRVLGVLAMSRSIGMHPLDIV
jgi:hypothetical protein